MAARTWSGGLTLAGWMVLAGLASGCGRTGASTEATKPPPVVVDYVLPTTQEVTEYEEFTGRTEAVMTVDVRARVTGYLDKVLFKDGDLVQENQPLFEIDPRTYEAEVQRLEAAMLQSEAHLARLGSDYRRARMLAAGRAIAQEEAEKIAGDRQETEAAVNSAKAALKAARLNLGFTKIKSPITGRISRRMTDPGNLVKADDTVLTTIVSLDPIHAYFDIDERTVLRLRRLIREGKLPSARQTKITVDLGLADETGYSIKGEIDFVDNRLDAGTGTLRIRTRIDNPQQILSPGMFLRLRLPVGLPQKALLVPEQALVSDQDKKFLYVINGGDKAAYRRVEVGHLEGTLRVVKTGLSATDRVIISGQQRIRDGAEVEPRSAK